MVEVKRTFAQKQAEARAKVAGRAVSRIERGYVTTHEKYVAKKTGVSALERAKYELETAKAGVLKKPTIVSKVPSAKEKEAGITYTPSGLKVKVLPGGVIQTYFEEDEPETDFYGRPIGAPKTYGEVAEAKPFTPTERVKQIVEYGYAPEIRSVGAFVMGGIPSPPKIKEEPKLPELKEEVARRKELARVTVGEAPPMPTAEVYTGWDPRGIGKAVFGEVPISEVPIAITPEGYEFPSLVSELREVAPPTIKQRIVAEIDPTLLGYASETGKAVESLISYPKGLMVGLATFPGRLIREPVPTIKETARGIGMVATGEFLFTPRAEKFYTRLYGLDPHAYLEVGGAVATQLLIGKGIRYIKGKVITPIAPETRTLAALREVKPIKYPRYELEAYTRITPRYKIFGEKYFGVKEFFYGKPKYVKTTGLIEWKPSPFKPEVIFTRGKLETALIGKKIKPVKFKPVKPIKTEVIGFEKTIRDIKIPVGEYPQYIKAGLKKPIGVGYDITRAGKILGFDTKTGFPIMELGEKAIVQRGITIKLPKIKEVPTKFYQYLGETVKPKKITVGIDTAVIGVEPRPIGVGVDMVAGYGVVAKQRGVAVGTLLDKMIGAAKVVAKPKPPKVIAPFPILIPEVEKPELVKARVEAVPIYEPALYQREELEMLPAFAEAPRLTQKQIQKQRQRMLKAQRVAQIQQQKQLQKLVQIPKVAPRLVEKEVRRPALATTLGMGLMERQIQVQKLRPLFEFGVPTPRVPIRPKIRIPPPIILPPFIPRKETKEERKRRKRAEAIYRKQQLAYAASVGAVTLGITAPRVPTDILTGLELRPVIRKKKGKKRKKKSRSSNNYINNLNKVLR